MTRWVWIAWVVLGAASPAWATGWSGRWTVGGEVAVREVQQRGEELRLAVAWPRLGQVVLRGRAGGGQLLLRAEAGAVGGAVDVLRGARPHEQGALLELRGRRGRGPGGEREARVEWRREGRVIRRERWVRQGLPRLEWAQAPAGRCDPQGEGPLRFRVRVLGRAQRLALRVELSGADRGRLAFYRGRRRLLERTLGELPVGEHELAWSGRDSTRARRVAQAGGYRLTVLGEGAASVSATTLVAAPRVGILDPAWPNRGPATLGDLSACLRRAGYRVGRLGGHPADAEVVGLLRRSAVVWVRTHGNQRGFSVYRPGGAGGRAVTVDPARLTRQLEATSARLDDLKAVVIYSCLVGAEAQAQLPGALVRAGADCVVSFGSTILSMGHTPWQRELSRWIAAGDSLVAASRKAAHHADRLSWGRYTPGWQARQRARGIRPLEECLVFTTAPGVDPYRLTLTPASYGRTDN
jgi:hypothetical protein